MVWPLICLFLLINALFDGILLDRVLFHFWVLYRYYYLGHFAEEILCSVISHGSLYDTKYIVETYAVRPYKKSICLAFACEKNKIDIIVYLMNTYPDLEWPEIKDEWSPEIRKLFFWKQLEVESRP